MPLLSIIINITISQLLFQDFLKVLMKNSPQQLYQNTIDLTQTQSFWNIWTTIKNSIFDVLFVLLDNSEDSQSMFGLVFQTGIDYLQMMAFPFNSAVIIAWNAKDTLNGITNFFNNFNVSTYIPGVGFSTFLVLLYSLIVLIIIVLCDICYVAYSFSKKKFTFTFPLIFMAKVVPVFVTVLFLPIMETLLQVTNCQTSQDSSKQVLQSFPEVTCWEGWHLFHTTITLIFSFLFVLISCIVALALFEPRMTTSRLTARQNSTGQVIFIINKIVCQFIFSFSPFDGTLPYCFLLFVLSGWLFYAYNIAQPYYDKNASKFFRICSSYYFWTNLMLLVSSMLESIGFQDGLVIWICGMIFIGLIIAFQRKSNIDTLFSSSLKFKSGQELENHLNYVLQLHHNRQNDKNSYMLLLGYIQKHIELCLEEDCPLKYNKLKFSSGKQEEQHSYQQLMKQLQRMFSYGIKKYPQCTKLRISLAFFYLQKQQNSIKSYQNFVKALETSPSFGQQFIIYRFKKIISENFEESKQNSETDLIELIRFDNHIKLCEQGMIISTKLQKQFWNELLEESPSLQRLNLIGSKIIGSREITKQNYEEVMKVNCNGAKMADLRYGYGMYLIYICHEKEEGKSEVKKSLLERDTEKRKGLKQNRKKQLSKINQIENTKRCLLVCQFNQLQTEKQGSCKIKRVNRQLLELTKYPQQWLLEKKLEEILPKNFQLFHDRKIDSYIASKEISEQDRTKEQENKINKLKVESNGNAEQKRNDYMGEYQFGFIRLSTGFIKKVKYRVVYQPFQSKFIAEIIPCSQIAILSDIEGIISEIDQSILTIFPQVSVALSLEDILGIQVMEMAKKDDKDEYNIQNGQLSQTLRTCFRNYDLSLEKIKISFDQKQINYDQTLNFDQTINITLQSSIKQIGFALTISQSNDFRKKTFNGNKKQPRKRINCFENVTKIIENMYLQQDFSTNMAQSENSQQNSLAPEKSFDENHSNNNHPSLLQQKTYSIYENEDGVKQIKIFRYFDKKFIRIYCDNLLEEESDYDLQEKIIDIQGKIIKDKIKDTNYKQKIKSALNSKFVHPEVITLFVITSVLLLAFIVFQMQLFIHIREQSQIEANDQINLAKNNLNDVFSIGTSLSELIINNKLSEEAKSHLKSHRVQYTSSTEDPIAFINSDGISQQISIRNGLIKLQSNILSFEKSQTKNNLSKELKYIYYNYLKVITPRISDDFPLQVSKYGQNVVEMEVVLSYCSSITLAIFLLVWIYQTLRIDSKIYKLLVWFLDIPFQYLHFASRQCQHFHQIYVLKNSSPALIQESEVNSYGQQYEQKKDDPDSFDGGERASENEKNRQIQISRHNKKSLKQFFSFKELIKSIVIIVLLSLTLTLVILHINAQLQLDIVFELVRVYSREYIWISNIPLILKINLDRTQWTIFQPGQISKIRSIIQQNVDESSQQGVQKFIQQTFTGQNSLLSVEILKHQIDMQFSDVCEDFALAQPDIEECLNLINGKLKGGYSVFRQYIKDLQQETELQEIIQIEKSFRKFTSPLLKKVLIDLLDEKQKLIKDLDVVLELFLYIFMVVLMIGYLLPWNIMLIKANKRINQAIQILNVVPIELLPIARKENRTFFKWMMKKSSQLYSSKQ